MTQSRDVGTRPSRGCGCHGCWRQSSEARGEAAFHAGTCGEAAEYREGRKAPELPGVRVSGLVHNARPGGDRWNDSNPWIGEGMAVLSWEGRRRPSRRPHAQGSGRLLRGSASSWRGVTLGFLFQYSESGRALPAPRVLLFTSLKRARATLLLAHDALQSGPPSSSSHKRHEDGVAVLVPVPVPVPVPRPSPTKAAERTSCAERPPKAAVGRAASKRAVVVAVAVAAVGAGRRRRAAVPRRTRRERLGGSGSGTAKLTSSPDGVCA